MRSVEIAFVRRAVGSPGSRPRREACSRIVHLGGLACVTPSGKKLPVKPLTRAPLALAAGALLAVAPRVEAQEPAAQLEGVTVRVTARPERGDCPDALEIARALAREAPGSRAHPVELVVTFASGASGYTATVAASGRATATRTLESADASCAALTNGLVAAAALMIDEASAGIDSPPVVAAAPAEPVVSVVATVPALAAAPQAPGPVIAAPAAEAPLSSPPTPPSPGFSVAAEAGAGATLGVVGRVAPVGYAGVTYRALPWLSIHVEGLGVPAQTIVYAPGSIHVWMAAGSVIACAAPVPDVARARLAFCAGPSVGVVHGSGQGYDTNRSETEPWVALGAGLRLSGPLAGAWSWSARVEPMILLDRQEFSVDGVGVGYSPQPVGLFSALGVQASIW
jgi:hypothetical protein